jgi:hypothetical protein
MNIHLKGRYHFLNEYVTLIIPTAKCIRTQNPKEQASFHYVNYQKCVKACEFETLTKPNIFQ